VDEEPLDEPAHPVAPRNPRQVRARRRRRRRAIGTLLFVVVALGIIAFAVFALSGSDDPSEEATTTTAAPTTSTTVPFSAAYNVTDGVNVRQGPGTTFPTVGTVETGKSVVVTCVAQGEPVNGPNGADSQWLKVTGPPAGYVTAIYVSTGDDLRNGKIPACPAA
jgi:uncharacterized protein YraI